MLICMAKTQKSFSDNEKLLNAPEDFTVTVREFEMAIGAGFIIPILGKMMRMPGLPAVPASEGMDIDENGSDHWLILNGNFEIRRHKISRAETAQSV